MKSVWLRIVSLLVVALAACASEVEPSGDFPMFWRQFSEAVARDSEPDVRALTRFPYLYEGRQHEAAEFPRIYSALFDEAARDCLTNAVPTEEDGQYLVSCGRTIFVFARERDDWRFTGFTADPES